jgi:pimeloyl-ACP methyl ester carboxylesterase
MTGSTVRVPYRDGTVEVEYAWLNRELHRAPLFVFLHEGLGSVSAWREVPARLCAAGGFRGLVYSRPGYGRSTPRPTAERWAPTYMHEQARDLLPVLLDALDVDLDATPTWLFGHSDGASIALIHASSFPRALSGIVVLAPHIFVEAIAIAGVEAMGVAYRTTDLRDRLAWHHADPDSAFWGWNDAWLDPAFRDWTLVPLLPSIRCPVLAVQGRDDEYGTLAQIDGLAEAVPHTERLVLDGCGHFPHRDRFDVVAHATIEFVARHTYPAAV